MTIADVSKKYNLTPDTLRYYERIGLIPSVNRSKGGIRNYSEKDCGWIEFIKCMRSAGISVEDLIKYLNLFQQGDATAEERKQILIKQRGQLLLRMADMQASLDKLNYKIDHYSQVRTIEQGLKNNKE